MNLLCAELGIYTKLTRCQLKTYGLSEEYLPFTQPVLHISTKVGNHKQVDFKTFWQIFNDGIITAWHARIR